MTFSHRGLLCLPPQTFFGSPSLSLSLCAVLSKLSGTCVLREYANGFWSIALSQIAPDARSLPMPSAAPPPPTRENVISRLGCAIRERRVATRRGHSLHRHSAPIVSPPPSLPLPLSISFGRSGATEFFFWCSSAMMRNGRRRGKLRVYYRDQLKTGS